MELKGLFGEERLHQLLSEEKITRLEYFMHHKVLKKEFEDFCLSEHLPKDDAAAERFFRCQLDREERDFEESE